MLSLNMTHTNNPIDRLLVSDYHIKVDTYTSTQGISSHYYSTIIMPLVVNGGDTSPDALLAHRVIKNAFSVAMATR